MTHRTYRYHVFLSHNGAQKEWTRKLAWRLRKSGLTVFFDEDCIKIGEDIPRAIERALRASRHVVLVLSREALGSEWVALEYSATIYKDPGSADRVLLPVLRSDCELPLILARLKYLDARTEDLDGQVEHLLNGIDRVDVEAEGEKTDMPSDPQMTGGRSSLLTLGGPVPLDGQHLYIERDADLAVRRHLSGNRMVVLTGPRCVGKTSLLHRICHLAAAEGRPVARVDLQMAGGASKPQLYYSLAKQFSSLSEGAAPDAVAFLERPAQAIADSLRLLPSRTLLAIDEFDALRGIDALDDFAGALRAFWNERVAADRGVSVLVVSVIDPSDYIRSRFASPFNVGIHIRLGCLTEQETERLLALVCLPARDAQSLHAFLGGHPHLLQTAAHALCEGVPLTEILAEPPRPGGPFWSHLLSTRDAVSDILGTPSSRLALSQLDMMALEKLAQLGIVSQATGVARFSCRLYEVFLTQDNGVRWTRV